MLMLAGTGALHVWVQNWPGPDKLAVETLRVATWTLVFAVLAFLAGAVGNVIAIRDFSISLRQWKRILEKEALQPDLYVTFDNNKSVYEHHNTEVQGGALLQFGLQLRLHNSGNAPARNVAVSVILPSEVKTFAEIKPNERQQTMYSGVLRQAEMHQQQVWAHAAMRRREDGSVEDEWRLDLVRNGSYVDAGRLIVYVPVAQTSVLRYLAVSDEGTFPKHGRGTLEIHMTADRVNTPG